MYWPDSLALIDCGRLALGKEIVLAVDLLFIFLVYSR